MTNTVQHRRIAARDALLDAAEKLFIERGYAAVSTRDLAEEAQVNLAAIQYHFGSKGKLFVEAVRRLMSRKEHTSPFGPLEGPHESPDAAALAFCRFVYNFLEGAMQPSGPDVCKIIYREAFNEMEQDEEMRLAIITAVVEGLHRPSFGRLLSALRAIAPEQPEETLVLNAQSVIAQTTFYRTHEPFLTCFSSKPGAIEPDRRSIARHIASLTLLSLGWSAENIQRIADEAARPLPQDSRGAEPAAEQVLEETV